MRPSSTAVLSAAICALTLPACAKKGGVAPGGTTTVPAAIAIDLSSTQGTYRDVLGINKAPRGADTQSLGANTYDLSALYKAIGYSTVRALDSYFDVCSVFTDRTLTNVSGGGTLSSCTNSTGTHVSWAANSGGANINNSANYSFTTVDANLNAIYNSNASLFIRLGENNNGPNDTTDATNYATAAKNLYRHVSGQGGGFGSTPTHTMSPTYIEVFNEPDGGFWLGTAANFYTLYSAIWDAVDAVAPVGAKIGGPAFTTTFQQHLSITANPASGFVAAVTTSRLDFLSAHTYGSCDAATLSEITTQLNQLRTYMNANGLSTKPLIISEWNIGLNCSTEDPFHAARAQAFNGAVMSLMQDTSLNIEKALMYNGYGIMSFLTLDPSTPGTVTVYPGLWAFLAHGQLAGGTLVSTQMCDGGGTCYTGAAGNAAPVQAAAVGSGSSLKVVLSNDSANIASTTVTASHWSGTSAPTATLTSYPSSATSVAAPNTAGVYTVSTSSASALISAGSVASSLGASVSGTTLSFQVSVPAYATVLVVVQ